MQRGPARPVLVQDWAVRRRRVLWRIRCAIRQHYPNVLLYHIISPLLLYTEDASTGVSPQSQHTTGAIENTRTHTHTEEDTAALTSSMRLYSHCRQYMQQYIVLQYIHHAAYEYDTVLSVVFAYHLLTFLFPCPLSSFSPLHTTLYTAISWNSWTCYGPLLRGHASRAR